MKKLTQSRREKPEGAKGSGPRSGSERMAELAQVKAAVQRKPQGFYVVRANFERVALVMICRQPDGTKQFTAMMLERKAWNGLVCRAFAQLPCGVAATGVCATSNRQSAIFNRQSKAVSP